MTESSDVLNKKDDAVKKKQNFLTKFVILVSLVIFGYFGLKYWKTKVRQEVAAKAEVEKFDNVDSEIFDLSPDHNGAEDNSHALMDLSVNELKEKGAEFIYQMLLKNQVQINDLKSQAQELREEFIKYKNQEKVSKLIFTYVDLRQKIYADESYDEALKNFELLSSFDANLQDKVAKLTPLLPNFSGKKNLTKDFSALIPDLIVAKNGNSDSGILAKIRHNISRLVVIRKISDESSADVDGVIAKTERLLREENYREALTSILTLDQNYHQILAKFLDDLSVASEVQKLDQEIFNYLKSLS